MSSKKKNKPISMAIFFQDGNGTSMVIPNFSHIGWKVQIGMASTKKCESNTDFKQCICSLYEGFLVGWILYLLNIFKLSMMNHGRHLKKYMNSCKTKNMIPVARMSLFMYMYHEAQYFSIVDK